MIPIMMDFKETGYRIFRQCYSRTEIAVASETVEHLCRTLQPGDPLWDHVVPLSILPERRNPGVDVSLLAKTPFILGDLPALSPVFTRLIASESLWAAAAEVLESDRIVYHSSNATRKPAYIGPNMSWHRDYPNEGLCPRKSEFFRALIPLEGMDEENGCTLVIPGTHCVSDERAIEANKEKPWDLDLDRAISLNLAPGDTAAIHSKVVHGGGVNRSSRERNLIVIQLGIETDDFMWKDINDLHFGLNRAEILSRL